MITSPFEVFVSSRKSLRDQIYRRMVENEGDKGVEDLVDRIGLSLLALAFRNSARTRGAPLARRGQEQVNVVDGLNRILIRDSWRLSATSEESGHPVFEKQEVRRRSMDVPRS